MGKLDDTLAKPKMCNFRHSSDPIRFAEYFEYTSNNYPVQAQFDEVLGKPPWIRRLLREGEKEILVETYWA
jgi:hypothetical protein